MRVVALSATFPNLEDVAEWIGCSPENCHIFSEDFRPVPLHVEVLSFGPTRNVFLFDKSLDSFVGGVITKYSDGKQTLIFCSSKNNAEGLAKKLSNQLNTKPSRNLPKIVSEIKDDQLRECIIQGSTSYHHAGLPPSDRKIVEDLFRVGYIRILCSTSTLAHGVNLPARLVIVKGTNSWRGAGLGYVQTKKSDILQMIGRAGRPGYDTQGIAVIMTSNEEKRYYEGSLESDVVESHLLTIITEGTFPACNLVAYILTDALISLHN